MQMALTLFPLGNSDLKITRIGFGSWATGGPWQYGWSKQSDDDSITAIHKALEMGINWIDTAAIYGLGHSEEVCAAALEKWSGAKPYIFTKCGMIWDAECKVDYSLRKASVRREIEASLRRLKAETIDLYQIHWPSDDLDETLEGWTELAALQKEGKVRYIATSNFSREELEKCHAIAPVTSLQPPYSLLRREIEAEVLPFCKENNIGVIVYSPMASGLLTGSMSVDRAKNLPDDDWRKKNPNFQEPRLSKNLVLADTLAKIGASRGNRTAGEIAIAWTLRNPAVTGAIVGARDAKQVEQMFRAADILLTDEEAKTIEAAIPA